MRKTGTILVSLVLILLAFGIVMLASTSRAHAELVYGDPVYFLKRQALWLAVALIAGLAASLFNHRYWRPLAVPLAVFTLALLAMTLLPQVGISIKGSRRWLPLGPIRFQPSELAKLAMVVLLSWWMARHQRKAGELGRGLLAPLAFLGLFGVLILLEPDFGTTVLVVASGMVLLFVAGAPAGYLFLFTLLGGAGLAVLIARDTVRMERWLAFLNPEQYAQTTAFQLLQGLYAFAAGGGPGVGLGQSVQKQHYLPEAHTDYIFAIIGEELGIGATLFVVLLYTGLFLCGLHISVKSADRFARLLSFGLVTVITLQAVLNIGVVTGCLPPKGIALPFISFGGTSLVVSVVMVGILANIAFHNENQQLDTDRQFIKDRVRRV